MIQHLFFSLSQKDLQTIDLDEFKYSGTNITAFRLVDPDNPIARKTISEWSQSELRSDKKPNERAFQVIIANLHNYCSYSLLFNEHF